MSKYSTSDKLIKHRLDTEMFDTNNLNENVVNDNLNEENNNEQNLDYFNDSFGNSNHRTTGLHKRFDSCQITPVQNSANNSFYTSNNTLNLLGGMTTSSNNVMERLNSNNNIQNINYLLDLEVNKKKNLDLNCMNEDKIDKLDFVLSVLDLIQYKSLFVNNLIYFNDLLLLNKEDLIELNIGIGPRNRILNFSEAYKASALEYSIEELNNFFINNRNFVYRAESLLNKRRAVELEDKVIISAERQNNIKHSKNLRLEEENTNNHNDNLNVNNYNNNNNEIHNVVPTANFNTEQDRSKNNSNRINYNNQKLNINNNNVPNLKLFESVDYNNNNNISNKNEMLTQARENAFTPSFKDYISSRANLNNIFKDLTPNNLILAENNNIQIYNNSRSSSKDNYSQTADEINNNNNNVINNENHINTINEQEEEQSENNLNMNNENNSTNMNIQSNEEDNDKDVELLNTIKSSRRKSRNQCLDEKAENIKLKQKINNIKTITKDTGTKSFISNNKSLLNDYDFKNRSTSNNKRSVSKDIINRRANNITDEVEKLLNTFKKQKEVSETRMRRLKCSLDKNSKSRSKSKERIATTVNTNDNINTNNEILNTEDLVAEEERDLNHELTKILNRLNNANTNILDPNSKHQLQRIKSLVNLKKNDAKKLDLVNKV